MRPTVLIVDDHAEFRRSAGALLEAEGFAVIAEAGRRRGGDRGGRASAAADRAARRAASRCGRLRRGRAFGGGAGIRPWSCSSRAVRRRLMARDFRRPPRTDSSRSGSSRARRSPRSSADRPDAVAPGAPLAGGGSARSRLPSGSPSAGTTRGHWIPDLVTGWTLIACGLVAWSRRGDSRSGPLLAATGFSWFFGNFATSALYLYRGPLVHLLDHLSQRPAVLASGDRSSCRRLCGGRGDAGVAERGRHDRPRRPSDRRMRSVVLEGGRARAPGAPGRLVGRRRPGPRARRGCGSSAGRARRRCRATRRCSRSR